MQHPQSETVTLNDILITEELSRRSPRTPNLQAENQALHTLARQLVNQHETMLQTLVDMALDLCSAGTVGVSLLETTDGEEVFRWNVLGGTLAHYVGGTTPRNFSPCGVCLERGTPQLFSHPERYFTYFQQAKTPIVEGLVLPLIADNNALGTIWIMSHDEQRRFDSEDVRLMTSLADFTAAALLLNQRQTKELLAVNAALEAENVECKRAEERLRALIENLPGGAVFVVDRDFHYLLAEGEALSIAKVKPEDFVGRTIFEANPPELAVKYEVMYRKALAGESFEHEHNIHDRSYISRGTPLRLPNGKIYAVLVVSYDISDRKRAELALRESEAKYRSLFNSIDDGFCILERVEGESIDFRYLEANPAFAVHTGVSDIVEKTMRETFPDAPEAGYEIYEKILETGESIRFEIDVPSIDRILEIYAFRIEDETHLAVIFKDITERKRAEAALRHAAEMDAFQVKLSDALRSLTDSVKIQAVAARLLGEHLSANQVHYGETIGDYVVIQQGYGNGLPPMVGSFRFIDFGERLIANYRAGQTTVSRDVFNDPNITEAERRVFTKAGFQAYITVPLTKAEGWVATLTVHSIAPRDWTTHEVELVQETAERTWAAVERARAEAALRESEIQRIREQAAREEERQRAESLAELDRAKTIFFSNISHEFRNPLTLLLAPLQDALSDRTYPLATPHRERLELAQRNANKLLKLVNTLLDFSRIEAGRMEAVYEPTDLAMFTTELASVFRSAIERAGLQLIVDCPPLPEPVYVDREMWEKIVLNLISNAFKFTFEGEIAVRLHLEKSERVILQIQDTGIGIPPEALPHLFERFYQVQRTKGRTQEGSGIGLALVHELIRLHGGTVDVNSNVGQGTCFTLTLALGTKHLPSDRLRHDVGDRNKAMCTLASTALSTTTYVTEVERWLPTDRSVEFSVSSSELENSISSTQNSKLFTRNSQPARILLVDDNADMRDYLTRILSKHVQVEAVADGASALAAAQERVPNLVLSDVMMPGLDGFELLQALRSDTRTREVPIILLSARAGEESIVEGLEAGADDYLIKPFSAQELVSRVNAHLQMAQLRSEALQQERIISHRKDELLSIVSHELNTPLVAILGWTRLLRANPPSPLMLMKALGTIERNATLQAKLIQDLLDISRITAGKLRLRLEPVELASVIEMAIASVIQTAIAKEIELVWQKSSERDIDSVIVMGDRDRLQQIICNLLTNAIKFTPQGGRVEVKLDYVFSDLNSKSNTSLTQNSLREVQNSQTARITVTDTGIGIAAESIPHIFDRFHQAEPNSSKGLGLGLAIARHLVELHNGTIHAASLGKGQGATFTVKLPILQD